MQWNTIGAMFYLIYHKRSSFAIIETSYDVLVFFMGRKNNFLQMQIKNYTKRIVVQKQKQNQNQKQNKK